MIDYVDSAIRKYKLKLKVWLPAIHFWSQAWFWNQNAVWRAMNDFNQAATDFRMNWAGNSNVTRQCGICFDLLLKFDSIQFTAPFRKLIEFKPTNHSAFPLAQPCYYKIFNLSWSCGFIQAQFDLNFRIGFNVLNQIAEIEMETNWSLNWNNRNWNYY